MRMIELFVGAYCGYCIQVKHALADMDVDVVLRDVADPVQRDRLLELGGKLQIPFLYSSDDGMMMYESNAIIMYLKSRAHR